MLKKLYKNEYGFTPRSPKGEETAPAAPSKTATEAAKAKLDNKSEISDNYELDEFDLGGPEPKKETKKSEAAKKEAAKKEESDSWGESWGEVPTQN